MVWIPDVSNTPFFIKRLEQTEHPLEDSIRLF